jgi:hypothetical protein
MAGNDVGAPTRPAAATTSKLQASRHWWNGQRASRAPAQDSAAGDSGCGCHPGSLPACSSTPTHPPGCMHVSKQACLYTHTHSRARARACGGQACAFLLCLHQAAQHVPVQLDALCVWCVCGMCVVRGLLACRSLQALPGVGARQPLGRGCRKQASKQASKQAAQPASASSRACSWFPPSPAHAPARAHTPGRAAPAPAPAAAPAAAQHPRQQHQRRQRQRHQRQRHHGQRRQRQRGRQA